MELRAGTQKWILPDTDPCTTAPNTPQSGMRAGRASTVGTEEQLMLCWDWETLQKKA